MSAPGISLIARIRAFPAPPPPPRRYLGKHGGWR